MTPNDGGAAFPHDGQADYSDDKCPKCGGSLLLAAGYWKCCACKHCIPYPTEADDLREQLVEAGKLIFLAAAWMLDHGGAGDPLRLRLKKWRKP